MRCDGLEQYRVSQADTAASACESSHDFISCQGELVKHEHAKEKTERLINSCQIGA